MPTHQKTFLTPEQYLEVERRAEYRSEYYRGEMFAMSGATRLHNLVTQNVLGQLFVQLRGSSCEVYPSNMRVNVPSSGLYTYPDIVVVCEPPGLWMGSSIPC